MRWITMIIALGCNLSMAAQQPQKQVSPAVKPQPAHVQVNNGQRIFEQNCSRCHNPPDGFSPRISGTVVRHMRARANLSAADMKTLMKFFHP
jgi:mono/diheme cytochrome c family protein